MIRITHNFDKTKFLTLWAKYVRTPNIEQHCQNCIHGPYSKKFSRLNPDFNDQLVIEMDETDDFRAIYFCGIHKKGYEHNIHLAVVPCPGNHAVWDFDGWHVEIENGMLSWIPEEEDLPAKFFEGIYTDHYYTCRIFRWMLGFFYLGDLLCLPKRKTK